MLVTSSVSEARLQGIVWSYAPSPASIARPRKQDVHPGAGAAPTPTTCASALPTGISFHVEFAAPGDKPYLQPLGDLPAWGASEPSMRRIAGTMSLRKASTVAAQPLPRRNRARSHPTSGTSRFAPKSARFLGLRVQQAGLLYSIEVWIDRGPHRHGQTNGQGMGWGNI